MDRTRKVRVLIVDDSPFGRMVLANALDERFEVCGYADRLSAALTEYEQKQPDIVTMDIAMPEIDGIGATKKLVALYSDAAVVIVSSMKDDELEKDAQAAGAKAFLQKPFESISLNETLWNVASQKLFVSEFERAYPPAFFEALTKNLEMLQAGEQLAQRTLSQEEALVSQGVAVVLGITGLYAGRMVLDFSPETARAIAMAALKREPADEDEIHYVMMEFVNLVGGHGVSRLNRSFKELGLRVALPGLFFGQNFEMATPKLPTTWGTVATSMGDLHLGVGFRRKEER